MIRMAATIFSSTFVVLTITCFYEVKPARRRILLCESRIQQMNLIASPLSLAERYSVPEKKKFTHRSNCFYRLRRQRTFFFLQGTNAILSVLAWNGNKTPNENKTTNSEMDIFLWYQELVSRRL